MIEAILHNLQLTGMALLFYAVGWLANTSAKLYYNIEIEKQDFDKSRFCNSLLKVLSVVVSMTFQVIGITAIPIFVNEVGFEIPAEYIDVFNIVVIIGVIITVAVKYLVEAFNTTKEIIKYSKDDEIIVIPDDEDIDVIPEPEPTPDEGDDNEDEYIKG